MLIKEARHCEQKNHQLCINYRVLSEFDISTYCSQFVVHQLIILVEEIKF